VIAAVLVPLAALILGPQQAVTTQQRRIVVREGDTIVIPSGVNARIDRSREGQVRIALGAQPREVVVLFDDAGREGPDGRVDVVFRVQLEEDLPANLLYRGPARLELIDSVIDGDIQRRGLPTLVLPDARVQFASRLQEITGAADTFVFRTTSGESRTLNSTTWAGTRSFDEVEHAWVNHLENNASATSTELHGPTIVPAPRSEASTISARDDVPIQPEEYVRRRDFTYPRAIKQVHSQYTRGALERGIQGSVAVDVTVNRDGAVSNATIRRSLDAELAQAAVEAARQWRFAPATLAGKPVPVVVTIELTFSIKK
jgi:TonB family protein